MNTSNAYVSAATDVEPLGSVLPSQFVEPTTEALGKLKEAVLGDVSGFVAARLHMSLNELNDALAAEQVDGVALAMYNIERRAQSVIIGDQTGIGKGRQAAAMVRYGLLSGYLPIFFTDRYTLFSDMYRDCKALGIADARPLIVNTGVSVVDFDRCIDEEVEEEADEIWTSDTEGGEMDEKTKEMLYEKQYEVVYTSPRKSVLQEMYKKGDILRADFDYLMVTYSQLKDARRDSTRLEFLLSLCKKHRVLFVFDEAHRSSSVSAGNISVITQGINLILTETPRTQCVFLSATFAKRAENLITFMRRTALNALATESTLGDALHAGGVQMQEYVSACLASEGQLIRRERSSEGIPAPVYTYLDEDLPMHSVLFDKVMLYFRKIASLASEIKELVGMAKDKGELTEDYKLYPTKAQLFYINKVLLLALKAQKVAQIAVKEVREGRCVVIGMSDTLECVLRDVIERDDGTVCGDISTLLLRLLEKTVRSAGAGMNASTVFSLVGTDDEEVAALVLTIRETYNDIKDHIADEVFHLPMSPIDVIRQLIQREQFVAPDGETRFVRFEECTGRAHQLQYLSPDGQDDFKVAEILPRRKRHSNVIFNDFQNNKLDVILINACGAIGASAHAISTAEVPDEQVRQRKMLIVQNDLDVNIDLQKRGRINRTGQRMDLPPLYEYVITAIPSEKRLNMMLRAKLRSLSANTAGSQNQEKQQADFIDIGNKYGDRIASEYLASACSVEPLLAESNIKTASKFLAQIAMLDVARQQEFVDDLLTGYTNLETHLRQINQWDLERDFRDFEAEFVQEEIFTTAKTNSRLGGCSYLTTYRCKQKTFPFDYKSLMQSCKEASKRYGNAFSDNPTLRQQVQEYYRLRLAKVNEQFEQRRAALYDTTKRTIMKRGYDEALVAMWLEKALITNARFTDERMGISAPRIKETLVTFYEKLNNLKQREQKELKKYREEKARLSGVLSKACIGSGFADISRHLGNEECPEKVIAVLRDIRFGDDAKNRFRPSQVEFVFALTAVRRDFRINLVHNEKYSNYERVRSILLSKSWSPNARGWNEEIAKNNNRIVLRKIITGNILGAYVHSDISNLKPRFISFSLKEKKDGKVQTQIGLLLPLREESLRGIVRSVVLPLQEGAKYATRPFTSYVIVGTGVNFNLMPCRSADNSLKYKISVRRNQSKEFEADTRFDAIRQHFKAIQERADYNLSTGEKRKVSRRRYETSLLDFESATFQAILQALCEMDAAIIVPRDHVSYAHLKELGSRSTHDENKSWDKLDWKNLCGVPLPPPPKGIKFSIPAPAVKTVQSGEPVLRHSRIYLLTQETMNLDGQPLNDSGVRDALRSIYVNWRNLYYGPKEIDTGMPMNDLRRIFTELRGLLETAARTDNVHFSERATTIMADVLNSEYLDDIGICLNKFDTEMLFASPDKSEVQKFLGSLPCSPLLDGVKKSLEDYLEGKTDVIRSPENWGLELFRRNRRD